LIYCILGQTASGKTSLALKLAREFHVPIISADAYQCYKIMQVGTDKPSAEEVKDLEYYFYDEYEPDEVVSVYDFQQECRPIIERCLKEDRDLIVVGGNFLYVKALLFNYVFQKEDEKRASTYETMSLEEMQAILKERSLETYNAIDHQNPRRIIRALIQLDEGTSHQDIKEKNDGKPIYPVKFYRLEIDKEEGNKKIDTRIDQMVKQGLIQEVTSLYERYPKNSRPFTTIGYIEIIQALKANQQVDKSVIDLIKIHTHQYAKKQRTFLRHQFEDIQSGSKDEIYKILKNELEKR
jgi:tRNA dimethylallyltransferase